MKISKELLSEVLRSNIEQSEIEYDIISYRIGKETDVYWRDMSIHELAHKVKEWAWYKELAIVSWKNPLIENRWLCQIDTKESQNEYEFQAATEPEAIFKAGQWILDNKDKQ